MGEMIERMARAIWVGEPGCIEQHVLNTGGFRPELTVEQQGMEICRELATLALCAALEPTEAMLEAPLGIVTPNSPVAGAVGKPIYESRKDLRATIYRAMLTAELES